MSEQAERLIIPTDDPDIFLYENTGADDADYHQAYNHSRPEISASDTEASTRHVTLEDTARTRREAADNLRLVARRGDGTFLGAGNVTNDGEIGYWVATNEAGQGVGTLVATALRNYAMANRPRVYARIVPGNTRSAHILAKLGLEQTADNGDELIFELHEAGDPGRRDFDGWFQLLQSSAATIAELAPLANVAPDYAYGIYRRYAKVVEKLAELGEPELAQISTAYHLMAEEGASLGSASKTNAGDVLGKLDVGGRNELRWLGAEAVMAELDETTPARADLLAKLEGGHKYRQAGKVPHDGDLEADKIIWGHTQITDPEALLHFTISHYLERFAVQFFASKGATFETEKDHFLNAITDVLTLDHLGDNQFETLFALWAKPREEGGLGWIKPQRVASFARAATLV